MTFEQYPPMKFSSATDDSTCTRSRKKLTLCSQKVVTGIHCFVVLLTLGSFIYFRVTGLPHKCLNHLAY